MSTQDTTTEDVSTDEFAFSEMQVETADCEVCCPLRTYEHLTEQKVSKFRHLTAAYDDWLVRNVLDEAEVVKEGVEELGNGFIEKPAGIAAEEHAKQAWLDAMKECKAKGKDDQYRTARKIADEFGWLDE